MALNDPGLQSLSSIAASEFYDVTITDTNSPIEQGDTLVVDYEVSNTGDKTGSQDITLEIDSVLEDTDSGVRVLANRTDSGTLEWVTDSGETAQDYTATVLSADDSAAQTVTVEDTESAIPDSGGLHQWHYDNWSGTTITDQIGTLDLNFTSITEGSPEGAGGTHGVLDGVDDYAEISSSEWSSLITETQGTIFKWAYFDESGKDSFNYLVGTDLTGQNNNIAIRPDQDYEGFKFSLTVGGDRTDLDVTIDDVSDLWIAYAFVVDGSTMYMYEARPPDYEMDLLGTASAPSSGSGDWEYDIGIGYQTDENGFEMDGRLDLSFYDDGDWSESELQEFVDDSKQFYE